MGNGLKMGNSEQCIVVTSDVNDAELLMPSRDFLFLMPSRDFHFRKKNEPEPR